MMIFACLVSLNGAGGRQENTGGESEVTETLQHQVEAGGQSHLQSDLETDDEGAEEEQQVRQTQKYQNLVEDCRHLLRKKVHH